MKSIFAAVAAILWVSSAQASQITILSIASEWQGESFVTERTPGNRALTTGEGTNRISWGEPFPGYTGEKSGFGFDAINTGPGAVPTPTFNANTLFNVGRFTHFNRVIYEREHLSVARLNMRVEASFDGVVKTFNTSYRFSLLETPNFAQPCANNEPNNLDATGAVTGRNSLLNINGCADRVTLLTNDAVTTSFTLDNGLTYKFELFGFEDGLNFWTIENQENHAWIQARFLVDGLPPVSEIPLPAGVWLLLGGLAGLGAMRRMARA